MQLMTHFEKTRVNTLAALSLAGALVIPSAKIDGYSVLSDRVPDKTAAGSPSPGHTFPDWPEGFLPTLPAKSAVNTRNRRKGSGKKIPRGLSLRLDTKSIAEWQVAEALLSDLHYRMVTGEGTPTGLPIIHGKFKTVIELFDVIGLLGRTRRFNIELTRDSRHALDISLPSAQEFYGELWKRRAAQLVIYQNRDQARKFWNENYSMDQAFAAEIIANNALLVAVARRHRLCACTDLGLIDGLREEAKILENLVPRDKWAPEAAALVDKAFYRDSGPLQHGGFVQPAENLRPRSKGGSEERPVWRPYEDPSRLLFYMGVPGYREMRMLEGDNKYLYSAMVFSAEKPGEVVMVLDTRIVGNCLYLLRGELHSLLELAQQDRGVIERDVRSQRIIHVGEWQERVSNKISKARQHADLTPPSSVI